MLQEKIPFYSSVTGITTNTVVIDIPFDSNTPSQCPIFGELHCIGVATISGAIKRFYFILPFIYNTNNSPSSIPTQNTDYDVTSSVFSHMEIIDDAITTAMTIKLVPYGAGLEVEFKPPSSGTWDVNCVCYIYKRLN